MAELRFSAAAEADLESIGIYTRRVWGESRAIRYINLIEDCCERLAHNPLLGRACGDIRPELRRMEEGRHVIFYRISWRSNRRQQNSAPADVAGITVHAR